MKGMSSDVRVTVERAGGMTTVMVPQSMIANLTDERFGILPIGLVPVVTFVDAGKPASAIGLLPGDTVYAVNGLRVSSASLSDAIHANAGKKVILQWKRGNTLMNSVVTPTKEGRIGITLGAAYQGPIQQQEYGLFEALPISVKDVAATSVLIVENLYQIAVGNVSIAKSVGGPIRIAQMANQSAESGPSSFLGFMALLSVSLALLNILPFPALDGGHIVVVVLEGILRRELPTTVKVGIQKTGFVLLLAFMVFVIYNDIARF
jgi:regulator of sigma E protease